MKIQLALDRLDLKKCHDILSETSDLIDIVEIGTSLIFEHGIKIISDFRKRYPALILLADTKIVDSGDFESRLFYNQGADIVTVLGLASDNTILAVKATAIAYRKKVMADMIGISKPIDRIKQLADLGIDYVCLHQGIDDQSGDKTFEKKLSAYTEVFDNVGSLKHIKFAIAGGLNPDKIEGIKHLSPEIGIVGSYITSKNEGWREAVESIKAVV